MGQYAQSSFDTFTAPGTRIWNISGNAWIGRLFRNLTAQPAAAQVIRRNLGKRRV
jgi:hypothetical protein